jgi:hypothetical protein
MRTATVWIGAVSIGLFALSVSASEQDLRGVPDKPCKETLRIKSKSRQRFDATAFMIVAAELQDQGEKDFKLQYDPPAGECVIERLNLSGLDVYAIYNPWEKGTQTLLYRFVAGPSQDSREVLVLYNGMVGMAAKGGYGFHLSETRNGVVSFYAMFKEEPTYQAVKEIAADIFAGSAKPLLALDWPEGEKEAKFVAFDSSRLK